MLVIKIRATVFPGEIYARGHRKRMSVMESTVPIRKRRPVHALFPPGKREVCSAQCALSSIHPSFPLSIFRVRSSTPAGSLSSWVCALAGPAYRRAAYSGQEARRRTCPPRFRKKGPLAQPSFSDATTFYVCPVRRQGGGRTCESEHAVDVRTRS